MLMKFIRYVWSRFAKTTNLYSVCCSSPTREFEFARLHRHNQGVAEGMTMRTTLGASVPLQIEKHFWSNRKTI